VVNQVAGFGESIVMMRFKSKKLRRWAPPALSSSRFSEGAAAWTSEFAVLVPLLISQAAKPRIERNKLKDSITVTLTLVQGFDSMSSACQDVQFEVTRRPMNTQL
jgi:hypothetical protein